MSYYSRTGKYLARELSSKEDISCICKAGKVNKECRYFKETDLEESLGYELRLSDVEEIDEV